MEVHLYIAYPLLFLLSKKFGPGRALLFALVVGLGYLALDGIFGIEQYLPYRFQRGPVFLPYWFTWAAGFYLAEVEAGRADDMGEIWWRVGMILGAMTGIVLGIRGFHVLADMFWALFFVGLLRWSLQPWGKRFWSGWLGIGLAYIGVFSYSLYAIHGPVLELFYRLIAPDPGYKFMTLWPAIAAVMIAVASAWVFFQLIERWSIREPGTSVCPLKEESHHGT
jgi:peptidoglycan/LPS O-acetylase OafA/YrhL